MLKAILGIGALAVAAYGGYKLHELLDEVDDESYEFGYDDGLEEGINNTRDCRCVDCDDSDCCDGCECDAAKDDPYAAYAYETDNTEDDQIVLDHSSNLESKKASTEAHEEPLSVENNSEETPVKAAKKSHKTKKSEDTSDN